MTKKKKHSVIKLEASENNSIQEAAGPSVCRVCLASDDVDRKYTRFTDLFGAFRDSTVYEHINSITDLRIQLEDSLPDKICVSCLADLSKVVDFRERCEKSNTALLNAINESYKNECEIDLKEEKTEAEEDTHFDNLETFDEFYEDWPSNITKKPIEIFNQSPIDYKAGVICNECNEVMKSKCKLRIHWKTIHLPDALTCQICKRLFKSFKAYNRHKKAKPRNCMGTKEAVIQGVGRSRIFGCPKCSYTTKSPDLFTFHYRRHVGMKLCKCKICPNISYVQASELQRHMEVAHGEIRLEITCEFCGKHIRGRSKVYLHLRRHSNKRYQCDICKKFYKNRTILKVHLLQHTRGKTFACDKCPASYYTVSALRQHKRIHSDRRDWFNCDICGYKSILKQSMQRHRVKHNSGNVCCSICGHFFFDQFRLQRHMKLHARNKKHTCGVCKKAYFKKYNLTVHMRNKHNSLSEKMESNNKLMTS